MKTTWLQVSGRTPIPYRTKKEAAETLKAELEQLVAEGWEKFFGAQSRGIVGVQKGDEKIYLWAATVDESGYVVGNPRLRLKEQYRTEQWQPLKF